MSRGDIAASEPVTTAVVDDAFTNEEVDVMSYFIPLITEDLDRIKCCVHGVLDAMENTPDIDPYAGQLAHIASDLRSLADKVKDAPTWRSSTVSLM